MRMFVMYQKSNQLNMKWIKLKARFLNIVQANLKIIH